MSNETELRQALLDAAANLADEIRLMEGIYFSGGQKFCYDAADVHTLRHFRRLA